LNVLQRFSPANDFAGVIPDLPLGVNFLASELLGVTFYNLTDWVALLNVRIVLLKLET
jgi:hypothetical protein